MLQAIATLAANPAPPDTLTEFVERDVRAACRRPDVDTALVALLPLLVGSSSLSAFTGSIPLAVGSHAKPVPVHSPYQEESDELADNFEEDDGPSLAELATRGLFTYVTDDEELEERGVHSLTTSATLEAAQL